MKVADIVRDKINRFEFGFVFTYNNFDVEVDKVNALKKILNRLVESGKISRLSKGRFYKPKKTEFGVLKPDTYQIVKDLLEKDGKVIAYLTGYSAYNELGLTTQVSNTIQIGSKADKKAISRGIYKITFIRQRNNITKENIPLLRILDSIRNIKEIPDTTVDKACEQIKILIKKLNQNEINSIIKLALKYNASTKALLGAIIEIVVNENEALALYKSLNPATKYAFAISNEILPNKEKWNIL